MDAPRLASAKWNDWQRKIARDLPPSDPIHTPHFRAEIETTSVLFTLGLLEQGEHLAILPEMLVASEIRAGRLASLDVDTTAWTRPLVVATRVRAPKSTQVAMLIEQLRNAFEADFS